MAYHNILSKLSRALAAYIQANVEDPGAAQNIYPAKRSAGKALPDTLCAALRYKETVSYLTNYTCDASIMVRTTIPADDLQSDPATQSDTRVKATFDLFHIPPGGDGQALADAITAAAHAKAAADPDNNGDLADFAALDVRVTGGDQDFASAEKNAWIDSLDLEVVCIPRSET